MKVSEISHYNDLIKIVNESNPIKMNFYKVSRCKKI